MVSCAITGHRPSRFKWKYKENNTGCKRLKKRLHDQFALLYEQGARTFYTGGALGVDMWAAEILLRLKEQPEYSEIHLIVAIPYEGYDADWDERSKTRINFIRNHAEVVVVATQPGLESYTARNRYMVDQADILLAVYDNDLSDNDLSRRSGTGMTVHYAEEKNIPTIFIHPDTGIVGSYKLGEQ